MSSRVGSVSVALNKLLLYAQLDNTPGKARPCGEALTEHEVLRGDMRRDGVDNTTEQSRERAATEDKHILAPPVSLPRRLAEIEGEKEGNDSQN